MYRAAALSVTSAYQTVSDEAILVINNKSAIEQVRKDTIAHTQHRLGCLKNYLHSMGIVQEPSCLFLNMCDERNVVEDLVDPISADSLINVILARKANWKIKQNTQ